MEERITLCGDNCIECPRYNTHTEAELRKVAELWYRVGWRDTVVSNEEIVCEGCSSHKACTYGLIVQRSMVLKNVINVKSFRAIRLRACWNVQRSIRKSAKKCVPKKNMMH